MSKVYTIAKTISFGVTVIMRKRYSSKFLWSKIDYIHLNPVRAGIVARQQDYIYSSASNYIDEKGLVALGWFTCY